MSGRLLAFSQLIGLTLLLLSTSVVAQLQFTVPDGHSADFSEVYFIGQTVSITWLSGWKGVGAAINVTDLWICWSTNDDFSELIKANVTFDEGGSIDWKVDVNESIIDTENRFVFRFKKHYDPPFFTSSLNESPSRQFYLSTGRVASTSASSSTSSSSPTSNPSSSAAASTTPSTSSSSSASPSSSSQPSQDNGPNTGTIVGASVGSAVAVGLAFSIGILVWRRRTKKSKEAAQQPPYPPQNGGMPPYGQDQYAYYQKPPLEQQHQQFQQPVYHLQGTQVAEMDAFGQVNELPAKK